MLTSVVRKIAATWRSPCFSCFDAHYSVIFSTADPSNFVCLCDDETESLPRAGDVCPCDNNSFGLAAAVSSFVHCINLIFGQPATIHFADETATIAGPVCRLLSTRFGRFTSNNGYCRTAHLDAPASHPPDTNRRSSTTHSAECFRSTGNHDRGPHHPVNREKGPARQLCTTDCGSSLAISGFWKWYDSEARTTRGRVYNESRKRRSSRSRETGRRARKRFNPPRRSCVKDSGNSGWSDYASDTVQLQQPLVDFERREQCPFDLIGTKDSSAGFAVA